MFERHARHIERVERLKLASVPVVQLDTDLSFVEEDEKKRWLDGSAMRGLIAWGFLGALGSQEMRETLHYVFCERDDRIRNLGRFTARHVLCDIPDAPAERRKQTETARAA